MWAGTGTAAAAARVEGGAGRRSSREGMRSSRVRRSSNKRREGRTRTVHEFNYNFEKLNGFKIKGMWAGTGEGGEGQEESRSREGKQKCMHSIIILRS